MGSKGGGNNIVKHVLLDKFKDDVSADMIEQLINGYAALVTHISVMKSFHWGKDVSIENLHQGFTHVFESTFESTEAIAEYIAHEKHVEFATLFLDHLEKITYNLIVYAFSTINKERWHRRRAKKNIVKHVLLAKFKDGVSAEKIEELIHGYAALQNDIPVIKSFEWGLDVSIENLQMGFTHVFQETFESTDAMAEYLANDKHVEFANVFLAQLDKVLIVDYKPTFVDI